MSTQGVQVTGAAGQVKTDAAGRMKVRWDRPLPGGATHTARTRPTRGLALALVLVCLLALPPLAPAEAVLRSAPASAPASLGDEYWAAGFNLPGMSEKVNAMAFGPDGSLYAGGGFTAAGGVAANRIARWDGVQWHPLGSGLDDWATALAVGPAGSLYAGGYFYTAGGVAVNRIARWDGAQWHPLGSGMDSSVDALAVGPDGSLYVGGLFIKAGGKPSSHIAQWTGEVPRPVAWLPAVLIDQ